MDYFSILQLEKEPFSNSPDPTFFFKSRQHQDCLQKVELALRLKRGLNVVMGDVGTGKTTLCRQLIRRFRDDEQVDTHLILDPGFDTPQAFLSTVAGMLADGAPPPDSDTWQLKEAIKKALYRRGVEEGRTVILIFDEGQKLPLFVIELLREFLNYETNTQKLLQIAIFAQCEFEAILKNHANFADRVNLLHRLEPMSFRDTREMIRYRLRQSSTSPKPLPLFTYPAMWAIYRFSQGYPRKIVNLCHQSLLAMIIQNRTKASLMLVRSCVRRAISHPATKFWRPLTSALLVLLLIVLVGALLPEPYSPVSRLATSLANRPWRSVHPVNGVDPTATPAATPPHTVSPAPPPTGGTASPEPLVTLGAVPVADEDYVQAPTAVVPPAAPLPVPVAVQAQADPAATRTVSRPSATAPVAPAAAGDTAPWGQSPLPVPAEEAPTAAPQMPAGPPATPGSHPLLLGRLRVSSGDTIVQLVRRVRGNYDPKYMDNLLALNPHIKDPDSIGIDDTITFPATPVKVSPLITRTHWLELCESPTLDLAHAEVADYRKQGLRTRLVPYWTALDGLRFVVLATGAHASPDVARAEQAALPLEVAARSRIRSDWGQSPVFFASPF